MARATPTVLARTSRTDARTSLTSPTASYCLTGDCGSAAKPSGADLKPNPSERSAERVKRMFNVLERCVRRWLRVSLSGRDSSKCKVISVEQVSYTVAQLNAR